MKTNWTKLLMFFAFIVCGIVQASNISEELAPVARPDFSNPSVGHFCQINDTLPVKDKVIVTDTLHNTTRVISGFLALEELLSDTIGVDSVIVSDTTMIDSLGNDTLLMDSLLIDTLLNDSLLNDSLVIDSVLVDSLSVDSLSSDSIIIKKDSLNVNVEKVVIPKSVRKLRRIYAEYRKSLLADDERWGDIYLSLSDIDMKPVFYKYVVPLTYYSESIEEASSIDEWYPKDIVSEYYHNKERKLMEFVPRVDDDIILGKKINRQLLDFYVEYPQLVLSNETRIDTLEVVRFDEMKYSEHNDDIINLIQNNAGIGQVEESDILVIKPNFWNYGGTGYLQFSQNYISDNWYKGGESTKSLLSGFTWQILYDDKQKVQYEGKFEWKLGFITAPSDTVHSYKANNDLLRISSKLGYKAIKNWYYTVSTEFQTQLFSNYATNSDDLVSAFFSPATLNVGVGMDYKFIKDGIINLSVLLNPLNYTMYSVASNDIDPTKFNIKAGHKTEHELGSRINATMTWKIFPSLLWESKFSYTTNYERVLGEWENTFTFVINKYLSTKLFAHARYDDSFKPEGCNSYFQFQELFSFGVNYTW